jgi:hypothetical protein
MSDRDERLFYLTAGATAAIGLGVVLMPLRAVTTASNLAFVFVVLTIVVAEMGGRRAALCTALASALSLNFFLTKPYLRLTIHDRQDVIAFAGLTAVGLVAAAFGSRRGRGAAALAETRRHLALLSAAAQRLNEAASESDLDAVLDLCRSGWSLSAVVVRDGRGYVAAASSGAHGSDVPIRVLEIGSLTAAIPADGARIRLVTGGNPVGWLDLWGDGGSESADSRQTVATLARLVAMRLAIERGSPKVG